VALESKPAEIRRTVMVGLTEETLELPAIKVTQIPKYSSMTQRRKT
jgi:hypothetical protein